MRCYASGMLPWGCERGLRRKTLCVLAASVWGLQKSGGRCGAGFTPRTEACLTIMLAHLSQPPQDDIDFQALCHCVP